MKRIYWIDSVKIIACFFVCMGHFLQSMVLSNVINKGDLYLWFNQSIYFFHVPLFFICSGYLYQKFTNINSVNKFFSNLVKKLINLEIPYFFFTIITWLLKNFFSGAVNTKNEGLFETLFVSPTAPYWYLYALFFLYLLIPTLNNKYICYSVAIISFVFKLYYCVFGDTDIFILDAIFANSIWFVLGMFFCKFGFPFFKKTLSIVLLSSISGVIFVIGSIFIHIFSVDFEFLAFLLGLCACVSICFVCNFFERFLFIKKISTVLSEFTLPVFLCHTIFAAAIRTILFKLSVTAFVPHLIFGVIFSFLGPVVFVLVLRKIKYSDFIFYPNKYLRIGK